MPKEGIYTILSTKILTKSQQELVLNAKLHFLHYDAIKIDFLDFDFPTTALDYLIFTSQNGVQGFLNKVRTLSHAQEKGTGERKIFCVGGKTKSLLEENGFKVEEMAENSAALAAILLKKYRNRSFLHVSGNLTLPDLQQTLKENNVRYKKLIAYRTIANTKTFNQIFDVILFFSPSGVQSFFEKNRIGEGMAICIGETTAAEAKKYTDKIIMAKKPTVENVIVQAVRYFKGIQHEITK